ncbi:MAG: NTP transferase domain-containing protein, partial [Pseudomonadales bacterium]|nr:NTP transferase domain-containing protein [Pseudomonadales bacterium]
MSPINGVILAGGQGSRMHNPHKPLLPLAGKSLLARV